MKSLIYLLSLLIMSVSSETYCSCFSLNTKTISKLKIKSDVIAIGKPIDKLISDNSFEQVIVFEIDSLIKGKAEIVTIMMNQNIAGNCAENFEICKEYLITGDLIENSKQTYRMGQTSHSKKFELLIRDNYMISTNSCRSFKLKSRSAKQFLAHKN